MQLSMDCPCDLADGLKVVLGESTELRPHWPSSPEPGWWGKGIVLQVGPAHGSWAGQD